MRRIMIISAMVMAMSMSVSYADAQSQGRGRGRERVEHRDSRKSKNNGAIRNHSTRRTRHESIAHAPKPKGRHDNHYVPRGARMVKCAPPRIKRGTYVPGWEGRVRYMHDGRWAYYVNGCWRYYDCYYNPYDFFCEPVPPRLHHYAVVAHNHASAGEVAAGVVAGTILGCIIGAVAN